MPFQKNLGYKSNKSESPFVQLQHHNAGELHLFPSPSLVVVDIAVLCLPPPASVLKTIAARICPPLLARFLRNRRSSWAEGSFPSETSWVKLACFLRIHRSGARFFETSRLMTWLLRKHKGAATFGSGHLELFGFD